MEGNSDIHTTGTQPLSPRSLDFGQDVLNSIQSLSQPVEMSNLSPSVPSDTPISNRLPDTTSGDLKENQRLEPEPSYILSDAVKNHPPSHSSSAPLSPSQTDSAIGPATDKPTPLHPSSSSGRQLIITLLLHSTETRHPYIVNEKYLKKRNVNVTDDNPVNMSVYTLKELIWRDWREEWEPRPASPTSIRLIHMGRMLDDKAYLKDSRFSTGDTPHVVHMTIKPQEMIDDEDARIAKGGARDRDGTERSPGCRCMIM